MNLKMNRDGMGEALRSIGIYAVRLAFIAFVVAMAFALWQLGAVFGQPVEYRALVSIGAAVGIFGHGVAITKAAGNTNAGRMLHGIALGTWLLLSVFLSALYALTSSERLAKFVPDGMADVGAIIYALTFAIGLFTSVLALVIPAVAQRPIADANNPTLGSAVARFGEPLFLILCIGASTLHLYEFGMNVAKVGMFATVAACAIADLAFIVAEKRVLHELKERKAAGRYDRFDLILWGLFGLAVLFYLVLVNLYAVRHTAGTLNASDPMLKTVIDFYGISPTLLILSMAALALITAMIDSKAGDNAGAGVDDDDRPTLAQRMARGIERQREGWQELRDTVSSNKALPAGNTQAIQNAKDGTTEVVRLKLPTGNPDDLHKLTDRECAFCGKPMRGKGRAKYHPACKRKAEYQRRKMSESESA